MKRNLAILFKGFIMGVAEIIPGVSGGTFALILGIYQRLINALSQINSSFIKKVYKLNLREAWLGIDGNFLLFLVLGMLLAAISFSSVIIFLFQNFPSFLKSFFSGILLLSLFTKPLIPDQLRKGFIIGFSLAFLLVIFLWSLPIQEFSSSNLLFIFLAGSVAVCAFILPGISGSFVLLILGFYQQIIFAIKELDLAILSVLFSGCLFGLLLFIQLLKKALLNYPYCMSGFFYALVMFSIPLIWKTDVWVMSFPNSQYELFQALIGILFGIFFLFILQRLSSIFQDT
ncbi:MAG: DUF368 domain-containing protein [Gammaproteobacteria bacterium]|nr:MAG: DUF368 domain-containing protein [Gammaproteobacteria bacterium]